MQPQAQEQGHEQERAQALGAAQTQDQAGAGPSVAGAESKVAARVNPSLPASAQKQSGDMQKGGDAAAACDLPAGIATRPDFGAANASGQKSWRSGRIVGSITLRAGVTAIACHHATGMVVAGMADDTLQVLGGASDSNDTTAARSTTFRTPADVSDVLEQRDTAPVLAPTPAVARVPTGTDTGSTLSDAGIITASSSAPTAAFLRSDDESSIDEQDWC